MKRILFLVLIAFVCCVYSYADQYLIEELSTTTINIGGIEKKVGDKFSDTSTIKWSSPKQFMRARNLNKQGAKSRKFYQAAFVEKQATSIADYYSKIDHLSTMGPVNAGKVTWHDGRNKSKYPEKRKAIVIGNSEYIHEDYLLNPVGDAILVTEKLQDLGFDVATCYDGQVSDMKRTLNSFCDKAQGCDVALFYYTGHGLQSKDNSINYLLPVNINIESGYDYVSERTCLSGLDVRDKILELQCKVNILLFDACRSDAPVKGFSSSAFTMEAGSNTVVMYSTSNGNVAYDGYRGGKNGPFATAFLDNVGLPGVELSETLKNVKKRVYQLSGGQTPSISDNVVTDFFFEPESKTVVTPTPNPNSKPQEVKPQNTIQVSNNLQHTDATSGIHNGHEWVDLGLPSGTRWATMNVGATSPSDYGSYFAWGETSPKSSYDWSNLKYCLDNSGDKFSKYVTDSKYGTVDGKKELDLSDDAAYVNWGSGWRMPSASQIDELKSNCTYSWTTMNGKNGYKVTSKKNGNSIFLPAAGSRKGASSYDVGSYGYYWSRSLYTEYGWDAYSLYFYSSNFLRGKHDRRYGFCVRPVRVSE